MKISYDAKCKICKEKKSIFLIFDKSLEAEIENTSFAMGIWWSADVDVGGVAGHCDERFEDVKRLFATQRLAQLCVYVDGEMVVSKKN